MGKSIKTKFLLLSAGPILILGIIIMCMISYDMSKILKSDTEELLRATAVSTLAAYSQNVGDYVQNSSGDIWKGNYNISRSEDLVDTIKKNSNMEVTFFYGDKRIMTSVKDKNGQRILASKAGDRIVEKVLKNGQEYFSQSVSIEGKMYYGYYVPVFQDGSDKEVVGMIFVGTDKTSKDIVQYKIIGRFLVVILVVMGIFIAIASIASGSVTNSIKNSVDMLKELAQGRLNIELDEKCLSQKDEIGEVAVSVSTLKDSLKTIINGVDENTKILLSTANKLDITSKETTETVETVEKSMQSIVKNALSQAESTEKTSRNMMEMGEIIKHSSEDVTLLSETSKIMKLSSNEAAKALEDLNSSNNNVKKAINDISEKILKSNAKTQSIKDIVAVIRNIADDTNLLALNANIEAARAGEAGKGFAVVAENVQSLAEQSNELSNKIFNIVNELIEDSNITVDTMNIMKEIIGEQNNNVQNTKEHVEILIEKIENSLDKTENISKRTLKLDESRLSVIESIQNLAKISKENSEETEATINRITEITNGFKNVAELASDVKNMTEEISEKVNVFEMN